MEEWWWGEFLKKNTGLDWWYWWWYVGDIIWISSRYHPHIIHISATYHPARYIHILQKLSKYHPNNSQISPTFHPNIIHISPTYGLNITWSIFFTTPNLMKSEVLIKIWNNYCRKKLHFEIWLKHNFLLSRYYQNIIQISSRNHPEIIHFYNPPSW